jgi:hypothetical protein
VVTNKNGTITTTTKKTSTSALRLGADFMLDLQSPYITTSNFFYVSPFYQTDYLNVAQITGVDLRYEPVLPPPQWMPTELRGFFGLNEGQITNYYSYITQFSAEAEFTNVSNPGYTALTKGRHTWLGETARPNIVLFPGGPNEYTGESNDWFNHWIAGRISLIGTQNFYWDASTDRTAVSYSAIRGYKLGACTATTGKSDPDSPCKTSGSSSISLEYDTGRDKDTYLKSSQLLVKLSFSYCGRIIPDSYLTKKRDLWMSS